MHNKTLLIIRSSVRVGTMDRIQKKFFKKNDVLLAYCPERTIEGKAVNEILYLPQLIGTKEDKSKRKANLFFKRLTKTMINFNSFKEPEFIKLLDNYYRDTKFAFANEVSIMCEKLGINAKNLIEKANYKFQRNNIPYPGPVGGPCLSKDPYILKYSYKKNIFKNDIYSRNINEAYVRTFSEKIVKEVIKKKQENGKISIIGITFKGNPDTNDIRNSTALDIIKLISNKFPNLKIYIFDKFVEDDVIKSLGCTPIKNIEKGFLNFKIIVIHGNNEYIKKINIKKLTKKMPLNSSIFDIWDSFSNKKKLFFNNIKYIGVGV